MFHIQILLLLCVPPPPSSLRARAWRRFRVLGAVPLKSGAYLLPHCPEHHEQMHWRAQEIQRDGGDGTLLCVERIENVPEADVVRLFQEARNLEYARLTDRYRKPLEGRRLRPADELARLTRAIDRIGDVDFFGAPGRREAERAREAVARRVVATRPARPEKCRLPDPTLHALAEIVGGADSETRHLRREAWGLPAAASGFREISRDDVESMARQFPVYDVLYADCRTART